jgi:hypothetical protein
VAKSAWLNAGAIASDWDSGDSAVPSRAMRRLQLLHAANAKEVGVAGTGIKQLFRWQAGHAVPGLDINVEMSNGNTKMLSFDNFLLLDMEGQGKGRYKVCFIGLSGGYR